MSGALSDGFNCLVYPWPAQQGEWEPGRLAVCSSIRLEALRESAEDYEYLKMLSEMAKRLAAGSSERRRCEEILERARKLVAQSNVGDDYKYGGSWSTFVVDGDVLIELHREVGGILGELSGK